MGNITVSLSAGVERTIRELAREKYGGRKGSMAKVISEAIDRLSGDNKKEKARARLLERMKHPIRVPKLVLPKREELYDRV